MNYNNKIYRSQSFVNRIQLNLANISSNPDDEFKLVNAYYDPRFFDCQLCGHKNCAFAYEVKNLKTEQILKVGSECIHHFKDKGVDINLAEALMKRVMSETNKARNDLKDKLGQEAWDALSEDEKKKIGYQKYRWMEEQGKQAYKDLDKEMKRDLIVNQFMIMQAKELLMKVSYNKHYLTEEETQKIVALGLSQALDKAEQDRLSILRSQEQKSIVQEVIDYLNSIRLTWSEVDMEKIKIWSSAWEDVRNSSWDYNPIHEIVARYVRDLQYHKNV